MSLTCPCGAVDSLTEDSCQALVCSVCGNVCQESAITSDITFEETATGGCVGMSEAAPPPLTAILCVLVCARRFTVAGQHLSDESRKLMALSRSTRAVSCPLGPMLCTLSQAPRPLPSSQYHRKIHKMMDFVGGNLKMRQVRGAGAVREVIA